MLNTAYVSWLSRTDCMHPSLKQNLSQTH